MEITVRFCTSLSDCSWMDSFHIFFSFHQWDSLHCDEAYRSNKLCYRFIVAGESFSSMCKISGVQSYVSASNSLCDVDLKVLMPTS